MIPRFISLITLLAFLNLLCGCTKTSRLTVEEAAARPKGKIQAVGLQGLFPFDIELNDIDAIQFIGINKAAAGGSVQDTVNADRFEDEIKKYEATKIISAILKSGEVIEFKDRDVFYDAYAEAIKVGGSEILFDSAGGYININGDLIYGCTLDGDSVEIKAEEIAYIVRKEINYTSTLLLIAGITTITAVGVILLRGAALPETLD